MLFFGRVDTVLVLRIICVQTKVKNDFGNFDQILVRFVILLLFDLILYLCHFNKHLSSTSLVNK